MKFPYSMLLDFVRTDMTAEAVGDLLTMAGFELEGIEEVDGDSVLDIKVVSNRGDGLSVFGLAREVLAKDLRAEPTDLYHQAVARFPLPDEGTLPAKVTIETEDCTRYACRMFEGVENGEAPAWIRKRLNQAGMRPISLLVDLTNYVMLEVGQPLHAFDYSTLTGGEIVVRKARPGEKLKTLNGDEHELRPDQMMICDGAKPVAAAGIMGGEETEVHAGTTRVLLESAHFVNTSVRRTRKQLGLSTEASYRFERSVDPDGVVAALNRFAILLAEADGGKTRLPGVVDVYPAPPVRDPITLRLSRTVRLLGMQVTFEEAVTYLRRLGLTVDAQGLEAMVITPPTWRPDLIREDDLIEEIGRVHGYERIPDWLPAGSTPQGGLVGFELWCDQLKERLLRAGFDQTLSHSLRGLHPLDASGDRIQPRVTLAPEMQFLRNSLLPSVADAVQRNGSRDLHFFEIGRTFLGQPGDHVERTEFAVISTGRLTVPLRANEPGSTADFFSLKGAVLEAFASVGVDLVAIAPSEADGRFHPTRQASLVAGTSTIGILGEIHPDVAEELGLGTTVAAELQLEPAYAARQAEPKLRPISRNPAVRRDLSVLLDKAVAYSEVEQAVALGAGSVLERQWLFDVYDGQGIPEGKHSLSIAIQLRKPGENFTDEEANAIREQVASALVSLGGTMR